MSNIIFEKLTIREKEQLKAGQGVPDQIGCESQLPDGKVCNRERYPKDTH